MHELTVELEIHVLLLHLNDQVVLFALVLLLQVFDLVQGVLVLHLEFPDDDPACFQFFSNIFVLLLCVHDHVFLLFPLLLQFLGLFTLSFELLLVLPLRLLLIKLSLFNLLTPTDELIIHFSEHFLQFLLLLLLNFEMSLLFGQLLINLLLVFVES